MKLLVDAMPLKSEECLFAKIEGITLFFSLHTKDEYTHHSTHTCSIDNNTCELDAFGNKKCNKLRILK